MKRLANCFLVVFLLCFCTPSFAFAQDASIRNLPAPTTPINLTLSPVSLNLETDPGKSIKSEMKIRNNSVNSEELVIKIGTFTASSNGETPTLIEPKETDTFIQWLKVPSTPFVINPGEWKTIPIEFSPPEDAALSYYYTLIVYRSSAVQPQGGDTVISGSPAILVLATVQSPNARRELTIESFRVASAFSEYLPQVFEVTVKNTGNVHLAPSGNIFIDGPSKKDVAVLSINPTASLILPQTTRTFQVKWEDGFPVYKENTKEGNGAKELTWDFSKADRFRIGKFTAHMLLVYDNGQRDVPIESFGNFWIIPWKLILLALFIPNATFILFAIIKLVKKVVNRRTV